MSIHVIEWLEAELAKLKGQAAPVIKVVENDLHAAESSAWTYIKTNGLMDAYAIARTVVSGAVIGTPWGAILATIVSMAEADGKAIIKGSEAIIAAQAQADLIVAGQLLPPATAQAA